MSKRAQAHEHPVQRGTTISSGPGGRGCSLSSPATYAAGVPYDEFARLRRDAPVAWIDEVPRWLHSSTGSAATQGGGYWAVSRYATVMAASRQPEIFSSALRGAFLADPKSRQDLERTRQLLINMDAPQHAAIRRLVMSAFTPGAIRNLFDSIRSHARAVIDRVLGREQFDVVRDVAAELPLLVLADLLGMPPEDRGLMYKWSNQIVGFDDPEYGGGNVETYQRTFVEAFEYAREMAAARRRQPGGDIVSRLLQAETEGLRLSEREFCHLWILLVIAGNETTRHLISGSFLALDEWPEAKAWLAANPQRIPTAVEELLRWVTPIMQFRRTATRDTMLDGQEIKEGDKVCLYYTSANRDEEVFDSADRLDLGRTPNSHLAFGVGPHFCLGAHLARLELAAVLEATLLHLEKFELIGPVVRLESNFMNGIKSMPSRFVL
jgi:cytochrome P450